MKVALQRSGESDGDKRGILPKWSSREVFIRGVRNDCGARAERVSERMSTLRGQRLPRTLVRVYSKTTPVRRP